MQNALYLHDARPVVVSPIKESCLAFTLLLKVVLLLRFLTAERAGRRNRFAGYRRAL